MIITAGSGWTDRIMEVLTTTVQINDVTIRNGSATLWGTTGGGLSNKGGNVTLRNSAVVSNTASNWGGGIYNTGTGATLTLINTAVLSNTTDTSGGGLYFVGLSTTLTITNSTFSGNKAKTDGGGVYVGQGTATLNNVTVTNNLADSDANGAGNGGGLTHDISSTVTTLRNTLIAGNFDNSAGTIYPDCAGSGTLTSQGYNLIGADTGCNYTPGTGDQVGTSSSPINPKLGALQNNGGPTLTHAPQTGSPAIDAGNPATPGSGGNACAANDQRGYTRPADGDNNGSALCDIGAYEVGAVSGAIVYVYDPLYRLIAANYSDGTTFNYTYDAVGNRLTQTTITNTTVYTYDSANRLTSVGAITYTWDANGNLLSDGVYTYTYDSANRPITIKQGTTLTYTFGYNGTSDRLRQVTNGVTTTYALNLNPSAGSGQAMGLTQVLADGTNTYLYGNGRIAQYAGTSPGYFLGDALGSVRQLTNMTGTVTLAKSYDPYGNILSSTGTSATSYDFAGEWRDNTGLEYLRARYYASGVGRFITRDQWPGDSTRPMSYDAWLYTEDNPINRTDPSGMCLDIDGNGNCDPGWQCSLISDPAERNQCLAAMGCWDQLTCPSLPPNYNYATSETKAKLLVGLLKGCPGPWHQRFDTRNDQQALKLAMAYALKWEASNGEENRLDEDEFLRTWGEAMAHKYWEGHDKGNDYFWLQGRSSAIGRVDEHYKGTKSFDQRDDTALDARFYRAYGAVDDVFDRYYEQSGSQTAYRSRPYDWGNPLPERTDLDGTVRKAFRLDLVGKSKGVCPNQVYYIWPSTREIVQLSDSCTETFHQTSCSTGGKGSECSMSCDEYKREYYPGLVTSP